MASNVYQIPLDDEIFGDNFAGGGGASVGIEMALDQPIHFAVNHDHKALGMHSMNHPLTRHYVEDVYAVDIQKATGGRPIKGMWFSPDCKHHSKARGQKPVNKNIRGLAWVTMRYTSLPDWQKPRVIFLENVEELQHWGGLIAKRCPKTGRVLKKCGTVADKGEHVTLHDQQLIPDPKKRGTIFRAFIRQLESQGYVVEWREIRASDLGAPTIRKRLYLIARCDGEPIVWRKATHAKNPKRGSGLKPFKTAADCIDFTIECPSIFDRKKPLADKTHQRIAKGMDKFVLNNANPFVVSTPQAMTPFITEHANGSNQRNFSADESLRTQCAEVKGGHFAVVIPSLIQVGYGEREGQAPRALDLKNPLGTVVAGGRKHALMTPILVGAGGSEYAGKPKSPKDPINTIKTDNHNALSVAFIAQHNTAKHGVNPGRSAAESISTITTTGAQQGVVTAHLMKFRFDSAGDDLTNPLPTITAGSYIKRPGGAGHAMGICSAYLQRHFGTSIGSKADEPIGAITTKNKTSLCTAFVTKMRGENIGHEMQEPAHTVSAGGTHHAVSAPFLVKYYGNEKEGHGMTDPTGAVTTKDRFGYVSADTRTQPLTEAQMDRARQVADMMRKYGAWDDREFVTLEMQGQTWIIVDIGMRMLTPRELARAQGFPDDYVIEYAMVGRRDENGVVVMERVALTKTEQVRMIGNSVCPPVAKALVEDNLPKSAILKPRNFIRKQAKPWKMAA